MFLCLFCSNQRALCATLVTHYEPTVICDLRVSGCGLRVLRQLLFTLWLNRRMWFAFAKPCPIEALALRTKLRRRAQRTWIAHTDSTHTLTRMYIYVYMNTQTSHSLIRTVPQRESNKKCLSFCYAPSLSLARSDSRSRCEKQEYCESSVPSQQLVTLVIARIRFAQAQFKKKNGEPKGPRNQTLLFSLYFSFRALVAVGLKRWTSLVHLIWFSLISSFVLTGHSLRIHLHTHKHTRLHTLILEAGMRYDIIVRSNILINWLLNNNK